jgi:hypothetical protein
MNTQTYIIEKYGITGTNLPMEIPGIGRNDLAGLFAELGFNNGAEIGVEAGLYSEVLLKANPNLHLYAVDPWEWLEHRYWVPKRRIDRYYKQMVERLKPYNVTYIKKFSKDALIDVPDESLDFVYIDADHRYEHVYFDLTEWSKKVRHGGIVGGHDFIDRKGDSVHKVKQAVKQYLIDNPIDLWFLAGARRKIEGEHRDNTLSYFWVKP